MPVDGSAEPPDAPRDNFGGVSVIEEVPTNETIVVAMFGSDLDIITASREDGPCSIQQARAGTSQPVSAGTLTVSAGSATPVVIPWTNPQDSYLAIKPSLSYAANDRLTISASGGTVPAFSGDVTFPASLTVTSGPLTSLSKSGFTATWDPTTSKVRIAIFQSPSGAPRLSISCLFDGAAPERSPALLWPRSYSMWGWESRSRHKRPRR